MRPMCVYMGWQLLLRLALASTAAASGSHHAADALATATIYTDLQAAAPAGVIDAMRAEVESILQPAGLHFRWQPLAEFRSEAVTAAVVVVHFEGSCDMGRAAIVRDEPGPLGWSEISDRKILPFLHVDCARVRGFLSHTLLGYRPDTWDSAYGRALGRVLAHELYHVFAQTARHASRGVGREEYSVAELLAPEFRLQQKEIDILKSSKALAGMKAANANSGGDAGANTQE